MKLKAKEFLKCYIPKLKYIEKLKAKKESLGKSSLILLKKTLSEFLENEPDAPTRRIFNESSHPVSNRNSLSPIPLNSERSSRNRQINLSLKKTSFLNDTSFMVSRSSKGHKRSRSNVDKSVLDDLKKMGALKDNKINTVKLKKLNFSDDESETEATNQFMSARDKVLITQEMGGESSEKDDFFANFGKQTRQEEKEEKVEHELKKSPKASIKEGKNSNQSKLESKRSKKARTLTSLTPKFDDNSKKNSANQITEQKISSNKGKRDTSNNDYFNYSSKKAQSHKVVGYNSAQKSKKNATISRMNHWEKGHRTDYSASIASNQEQEREMTEGMEDMNSMISYHRSEALDPTVEILEIMSMEMNQTYDFEPEKRSGLTIPNFDKVKEINQLADFTKKKPRLDKIGRFDSQEYQGHPKTIDKQLKEVSERSKNMSTLFKKKLDKPKSQKSESKSARKQTNYAEKASDIVKSSRIHYKKTVGYKEALEEELKRIKRMNIFKRETLNFNSNSKLSKQKKRSKTSNKEDKKQARSNTSRKKAVFNQKSFLEDEESEMETESMLTEVQGNKRKHLEASEYYESRSIDFNLR